MMENPIQERGICAVGDTAWGTHVCLFYQSADDLTEVLVPYFKAGLENNEFCMWVTSEPLRVEDAKSSLESAVRNLNDFLKKGQIEILDCSQWYTKSGMFEADRVLQGWVEKENQALKKGFAGLRLAGNTSWLQGADWKDFIDYEATVDHVIGQHRIIAVCTYSLGRCGAPELIDVVSNHDFALIRRAGKWEKIESSERKQAEEQLRESRDFLEKLLGYTNVPIIVWNSAGRIIRFNRAFERLTGYAVAEVIGQELSILFPEPGEAESIVEFARAMGGQHRESVEVPIRCKNGVTRTLLWNSANVYSEDGATLLAVIAQGVDITERNEAEEATRQAQEKRLDRQRHEAESVETELAEVREELVKTRLAAIGQISASIAHELRNPLGSVRNAVFYLKRHLPKDEPELTEFLQIIENEVEDADRIIGNLLELTRRKPAAKQAVDLRQLVEDAFSRIRDTDEVRCQVSTDPDPFEIQADPDQFRQILINLGKNAVQAMKGKGELIVQASRSASCDVIVVRDTGSGVPGDVRERLFEPLMTTKSKGTGLGLTICRQIVDRHGGTIELVENEGPGAAFQISLPRERQSVDTR